MAMPTASQELVRAVALEHDLERLQDELEVVPELAIATDIVVVEAHLTFERDVAAATDLPNAGKARRHGEAHAVPRLVFGHFRRNRRARSDNGHIAFENVDELRQFIEAELAENVSKRVNTRVVLHLEGLAASLVLGHEFFSAFFGVNVHAAELVHGEQRAVLANASLLEDDRALRVADFDGERTEQQERREYNQCSRRAGDVYNPLDDVPKADLVRVDPDVRKVQTVQREEASVSAVEFLQLVVHFEVVLFLVAGVKVCLENRGLGLVAECLDETCVVELVEDFLADAFERAHVGIQEDDADTAIVAQITENIDKAQVRKHRKNADFPRVFDNFGRTAPAEHVVLVRINLDEKERLAGAVRAQKFLVQPRLEEPCGVNDIL